MTPLVSILIPCFNAEKYVGPAIESALAQTWPNKEIIVVDDGSSDSSVKIAGRFSSDTVRVLSQQNRGASAARNAALRASTGEYVKFFDADDLIHPGLVDAQVRRLAGRQDAVASAEWGRFYDDDLATFRLSPEQVWRDMEPTEWLVQSWINARPMMQCALWLVPRQIIDRCGGWDERLSPGISDDFEFFTRVLCHATEVCFTDGVPVYYRSGIGGTLSRTKGTAAIDSAYLSMLSAIGSLLVRRRDTLAHRACANIIQHFIFEHYPANAEFHSFLLRELQKLGGSDDQVRSGSPTEQRVGRIVGWRVARRLQIAWRAMTLH